MSRATDKQLRRLVLDLAGAPAADREDVLIRLEPAQQLTVRRLLAEHGAAAPQPAAPAASLSLDETPSREGLSDWIVQRLDVDMTSGRSAHRVTPNALQALHRAVERVQPPAKPPAPAPPMPDPGRFRRFIDLLREGRGRK